MLVLKGNNPRFPWEPSTTMLTNRLSGTTEASASYRDGPHHSDRLARDATSHAERGPPHNLRSPWRAQGSAVLTSMFGSAACRLWGEFHSGVLLNSCVGRKGGAPGHGRADTQRLRAWRWAAFESRRRL